MYATSMVLERLSCRYLCCAARNPPSDDSQRHKSLVSHLSGTFPSLPSASLHLFILCFSISIVLPVHLLLVSSRCSSSFFDFSPNHAYPAKRVLQTLVLIHICNIYIYPLYFPVFGSIVPRSWWCQPRAPE